jgi:hypothetical protein
LLTGLVGAVELGPGLECIFFELVFDLGVSFAVLLQVEEFMHHGADVVLEYWQRRGRDVCVEVLLDRCCQVKCQFIVLGLRQPAVSFAFMYDTDVGERVAARIMD